MSFHGIYAIGGNGLSVCVDPALGQEEVVAHVRALLRADAHDLPFGYELDMSDTFDGGEPNGSMAPDDEPCGGRHWFLRRRPWDVLEREWHEARGGGAV